MFAVPFAKIDFNENTPPFFDCELQNSNNTWADYIRLWFTELLYTFARAHYVVQLRQFHDEITNQSKQIRGKNASFAEQIVIQLYSALAEVFHSTWSHIVSNYDENYIK